MSRPTSAEKTADRHSESEDERNDTNTSKDGSPEDQLDRKRRRPEKRYSRETLMDLRGHPLSQKRPAFLNQPPICSLSCVVREGWDGERNERKQSESSVDERRDGTSFDLHLNKRRTTSGSGTADPRERVRKEQDGIVLSPERRSFKLGCYVTQATPNQGTGRRPESPLGGKAERWGQMQLPSSRRPESPLGGKSEREPPTRRIGSGRISWRESGSDFGRNNNEKEEQLAPDYGPSRMSWEFRRNADKDDSMGPFRPLVGGNRGLTRLGDRDRDERCRWDFDRERERDLTHRNSDRGRNDRNRNDRMKRDDNDYGRRRNDSREEEPEWWSAGPTSQHDTIELRGFEDIPEDGQAGNRKKQTQNKLGKTKEGKSGSGSRKNSDVTVPTGIIGTAPLTDGTKKDVQEQKGGKSSPLATSSPDSKRKSPKPKSSSNDTSVEKKDKQSSSGKTSPKEKSDRKSPAPTTVVNGVAESDSSAPPSNTPATRTPLSETGPAGMDFNLEEFLKSDALPMLSNGGPAENSESGSRFRRWFQNRESPVQEDVSKPMQDNLVPHNDVPGGTAFPPRESEAFFAPISPAATSIHPVGQPAQGKTPVALLEMLQRGPSGNVGGQGDVPSLRDLEASGKIHSVGELEARMRKSEVIGVPPEPRMTTAAALEANSGKREDMAAFRKLVASDSGRPLAKVSGGSRSSSPVPPCFDAIRPQQNEFLQILKRCQEPQVGSEAPNLSSVLFPGAHTAVQGPPHPGQMQQQQQQQNMHIPPELVMKLLHVQQQASHQQQHQQQQQQQQQHHQQQQQQHQQQQQRQQQQQQQFQLNKLLAGARVPMQQVPSQPPQQQQQQIPQRRPGPPQGQFPMGPQRTRSPVTHDLQAMVASATPNKDLIHRTEAQALLRGLQQGEMTTHNIIEQLQNPALTHRHRDLLVSVLKTYQQHQQHQQQQHQQMKSNALSPHPGVSPRSSSPLVDMMSRLQEQAQMHSHAKLSDVTLHQMMLQQQQQQHQQQQLRIPSPLNAVYCQPPGVSPNALTVQPVPPVHPVLPRVPSPRDLVIHTQNIMQSALIKKKLEEQRENYRKRQEQHRSVSPNVGANKDSVSNSGKNPIAFTPTSVLKKMTAEKDGPLGLNLSDMQHQSQQHHHQQQQQRILWNMQNPPLGRPIVKGSGNLHSNLSSPSPHNFLQQPPPPQQPQPQMRGMPQNQGPPHGAPHGAPHAAYAARSKLTALNPFTADIAPMTGNVGQQRAQSVRAAQALQAHLASIQQQNQPHHLNPVSSQQMPMAQSFSPHSQPPNRKAVGHGGSGDLSTSPTSNQLTRWFSPEMLARARSGPSVPAQGMLSVEDLERLQQAVHN